MCSIAEIRDAGHRCTELFSSVFREETNNCVKQKLENEGRSRPEVVAGGRIHGVGERMRRASHLVGGVEKYHEQPGNIFGCQR